MARGRPPSDERKTILTQVRQTPEEREEWQRGADAQRMTLSEFMRAAVKHYLAFLQKSKK